MIKFSSEFLVIDKFYKHIVANRLVLLRSCLKKHSKSLIWCKSAVNRITHSCVLAIEDLLDVRISNYTDSLPTDLVLYKVSILSGKSIYHTDESSRT